MESLGERFLLHLSLNLIDNRAQIPSLSISSDDNQPRDIFAIDGIGTFAFANRRYLTQGDFTTRGGIDRQITDII